MPTTTETRIIMRLFRYDFEDALTKEAYGNRLPEYIKRNNTPVSLLEECGKRWGNIFERNYISAWINDNALSSHIKGISMIEIMRDYWHLVKGIQASRN